MTIHELFNKEEQEIIMKALEAARNNAKKNADAPIWVFGKSTEYAKKEQWKIRQEDIENLLSKIVELTF